MKSLKHRLKTFLLWSQKYTKADMLYLANGSFWLGLSQSLNTIISLGLTVAFANMLPKETFGTYRYILSLAAVLNIFTLGGMHTAVVRSVAAGYAGALTQAVRHQLRWNTGMFIAFCAMGSFYLFKGDLLFATSFFILGVFTPATLALNTYGSYLAGKKEFKYANIFSIASTLVYAVGICITLFMSGEILWLVTAYAVTSFVPALIFYLYTIKNFVSPTEALESDPDMIPYAKRLSYIGFIGTIVSQIDKIILAQFWGPAQLATYSLAIAVPGKIVPYLKKFVNLGLPKFSQRNAAQLNKVLYRRIFQGMAVGGIITLAYVIISPTIFKYLLPQYLDGVLYSQILAVSFIFSMPTRYLGQLLESQKMTKAILATTVANSLLAIILYTVLGIWGGIMGLVIAYLLWTSIGFFINLVVWLRASRNQK